MSGIEKVCLILAIVSILSGITIGYLFLTTSLPKDRLEPVWVPDNARIIEDSHYTFSQSQVMKLINFEEFKNNTENGEVLMVYNRSRLQHIQYFRAIPPNEGFGIYYSEVKIPISTKVFTRLDVEMVNNNGYFLRYRTVRDWVAFIGIIIFIMVGFLSAYLFAILRNDRIKTTKPDR